MVSPSACFTYLPLLCAAQCKAAFRVSIKKMFGVLVKILTGENQNFLDVNVR